MRCRSAKYNDTSRLREQKIKSRVTLVKPTVLSMRDAAENYDMDEFLIQEMEIKVVEGNHRTMLDNPNCADIVNDILGFGADSKESFKENVGVDKDTMKGVMQSEIEGQKRVGVSIQ